MKYSLNILLMSLIPTLSLQHKYQQQQQEEKLPTGAALAADDFLMETKTEDNFLDITSSKANALSAVLEDQLKPTLKLFEFDDVNFYRQLNATMYGGVGGFNFSLSNSSYDGFEDEGYGCNSGQHTIINLITMILYSVVCIIGLFGNTLVIYVVLRFSKMQTVTNIYILNLAIADECFLIGIPFLLYTMQIGSFQFGEYACKAYMVSTSITQFTSSIFLLIMSADRYIAVCHPISSPRYRTPLVSKMVSGIAWLTSVLLMLPVILFANTVENGEHRSCNIKWPEAQNTQSGTTFILYSLALGFATPLIFILGFYCLVIRKLHTVGPKHKSKEKKRSHRKVTKLVLTVITVYILCWLPYWISQVALITSPPGNCVSRLEITIFLLVGCLGYSNSAMNPILYAFLSDNFKKSFMKACTCAARKDVNAQLQLENSLFPKFNKSRPSDKLLSNTKQKNSILNRKNNKAKNMVSSSVATTITCTTNTTTLEAGNNIAICPSTQMKHLLENPASQPTTSSHDYNSQLTAIQGGISENSNLENSSECSDTPPADIAAVVKPPVLHTDL
ncbi:somatostatin receptor type 2 [Lucilia cuprina]|uniref:somatostatin receptor type 2 n=1 Tax=Lucilia cuprina TaxID=7375 RepID=UPI001F06CF04|nr:somatostatin receptor type 2 [Lucilia cuprina]